MSISDEELQALLAKANEQFNALSPEEQQEHRIQQAISFVYGNLAIDNPAVSRELVEATVRKHYTKIVG